MPSPPPKTLQELQNPPMERLKTFNELLQPDPRYAEMMLFGEEDTDVTYTFKDHYDRFALLAAPPGAPEEVVGAFVTAQHLSILSWLNFPLSSLSEAQAYFSLELALRRRMNAAEAPGLRARLEFAIRKGWIHPDRLFAIDPCLTAAARQMFRNRPLAPDGRAFLQHLVEELPRDRNWLAHGNFNSGTDSFITLDVVAQLLNQIYVP